MVDRSVAMMFVINVTDAIIQPSVSDEMIPRGNNVQNGYSILLGANTEPNRCCKKSVSNCTLVDKCRFVG